VISVLTVTYNRRALLEEKLRALARQTLPPNNFELIVCVNGSADGTLEMLRSARTPYPLKVVSFAEGLSIAAARNACVREARGRVLYFSDDDCLPEPATLERHLEAQRRPCVAVGAITFVHGGAEERWRPRRVGYWNANGANTSVSADAFRAVGGFDEALTGYGGEDLLLGYALKRRGLPFVALPSAPTRHLGPNPVAARNPQKARSAGRNAQRIAARHPELAYRLGVHRALITLKRLALRPPQSLLWRALNAASFHYERAYLEGALEERRDPAHEF